MTPWEIPTCVESPSLNLLDTSRPKTRDVTWSIPTNPLMVRYCIDLNIGENTNDPRNNNMESTSGSVTSRMALIGR